MYISCVNNLIKITNHLQKGIIIKQFKCKSGTDNFKLYKITTFISTHFRRENIQPRILQLYSTNQLKFMRFFVIFLCVKHFLKK